jgi:hypothetical protein
VRIKDEAKLKSWILFVIGLAGIGYQQYTGRVHWLLLLIFTTMTGVLTVTQLVALLKSSHIVSSLSSSQQSLQEPDSDSSSTNASENNEK